MADFTPEEVVALHRSNVRCKSSFVTSRGSKHVPVGVVGDINGWMNLPPIYVCAQFRFAGRSIVAFISKQEWDDHMELLDSVH